MRTCRVTAPDLKNGWTDRTQIWYTDKDQLLGCRGSQLETSPRISARAGLNLSLAPFLVYYLPHLASPLSFLLALSMVHASCNMTVLLHGPGLAFHPLIRDWSLIRVSTFPRVYQYYLIFTYALDLISQELDSNCAPAIAPSPPCPRRRGRTLVVYPSVRDWTLTVSPLYQGL